MSEIIKFFQKPIVTILGSFASVASVILALYFYSKTREERSLTYYVHPVRTSFIDAGKTSDISASFKNIPVEGDVSAVQVVFWNAGKKPIFSKDILEPFQVITDKAPILDVSITGKSRDIVSFELKKERFSEGVLGIRWNVLEHNDGASVRLIYMGDVNNVVSGRSIIVGQKVIVKKDGIEKILTPVEQLEALRIARRINLLGLSIFMLIFYCFTFIFYRWFREGKGPYPVFVFVLSLLMCFLTTVSAVVHFLRSYNLPPSF